MKTSFKRQIKELISRIDYPVVIYLYETGRITALSKRAVHLIGEEAAQIGRVWEEKENDKIKQAMLNNQSFLLSQCHIINGDDRIAVDMEVNIIDLSEEHLVIILFEQSYKKTFYRYNRKRVPRILWRNKELELAGYNTLLKRDMERKLVEERFCLKMADDAYLAELRDQQLEMIHTKGCQFDLLEEVYIERNAMSFAKLNRIVLENKAGSGIGTLTMYTLMIEDEVKQLHLDDLQRENNILAQALLRTDEIAVTWRKGEAANVDYISANIKRWGYAPGDFYEKGLTWKDIVVEEDYPVFLYKDTAALHSKGPTFCVEYRIHKKNGDIIWVKDETINCTINDKIKYKQGMLTQIEQKDKNNICSLLKKAGGKASENTEFVMFYQPILDENAKNTVGAEALLRWKNKESSDMSPTELLSMSEYLGIMGKIGDFVFEDAFTMCREWNETKDPHFRIHINLSAVQLSQPYILEQIMRIAGQTEVNTENIVFEIKESLALEDMQLMKSVLTKLKQQKFSLLLDNFGTGVSGLNTIMELPLDYIKLDESYIRMYGTDKFKPGLLVAIVELLHELNKKVIVSGIETKKQMDFLFLSDVDGYQGFYIGYPIPKERFI